MEEILTGSETGRQAPNLFRTLAHNPRVLKRFNVFGGGLVAMGKLPPREREIIILRTAYRCRSEYEFGHHTLIGRTSGLSDAEIAQLAAPEVGVGFSPADLALVAAVDELYDANQVGEVTWGELAARWSEAELIEILMLAGFYWMLACLLNSVEVQRDPGIPGWPEPFPATG